MKARVEFWYSTDADKLARRLEEEATQGWQLVSMSSGTLPRLNSDICTVVVLQQGSP